MKILVTGGAGYIGSHIAVQLLQSGYEVVIADNLSNSSSEVINRIKKITNCNLTFYQYDLQNKANLEEIFASNEIDAVIHTAGFKAVGESVEMPLKYYRNNLTGTINLCELMAKYKVKKLVFSSSATVYGMEHLPPLTEDMALAPVNPYGRTKMMIEQILKDLYVSDNAWSIVLLRYFNPVGAHESGLIGEAPIGVPNNLMPYMTQVAVGLRDKIKIFGNDYHTHDGTGVRDYIHVIDLAKGHLKALEKIMTLTGLKTYNLGTGKGYSVLELITAFEQATGIVLPYVFSEKRQGDIAVCYADNSLAQKELAWKAEKSIEDMCRDSWRWQAMNPNGYT